MSTHRPDVHMKISPAHPFPNYTHTTNLYLHRKYNKRGFTPQRARGYRTYSSGVTGTLASSSCWPSHRVRV
jgi:hypothetical protein